MSQLVEFVNSAREKGLDDETIRRASVDQGWADSEITIALAGLETPKPTTGLTQQQSEPIDPTSNAEPVGARPSLGPLIAALHHILLWFFTISSSLAIAAAVSNIYGYATTAAAIASFLAVLVITLVVYLVFYVPYLKNTLKPPYQTANRPWSIITICLHGVAGMGAAIGLLVLLINDGDITWITTWALILFMTIVVIATYAAATFINPTLKMRKWILLTAMPSLALLLIVLFGWSIAGFGDLKHDDQTRKNLVQTVSNIRGYAEATGALPADASSLLADKSFTYKKKTYVTYQLCADFKRVSLSSSKISYPSSTATIGDDYVHESDFSVEKPGNKCFDIRTYSNTSTTLPNLLK